MKKKKEKQPKLHIKTGDLVQIIAGNDKGKRGEVRQVDLQNRRAIVDGLNMVSKHMKPSANNPQGEIVEVEAFIHVSNLMIVDKSVDAPRRTKKVRDENGKASREFKSHTSLATNPNQQKKD